MKFDFKVISPYLPGGANPSPRSGVAAERSKPKSKEVAARAQEGQEELLHVQGQEGRW